MARLGDICEIQSGGTPARSNTSFWDNGTIPWVKISDIKLKHLNHTEEYITQDGLENSSAKIFPAGTILYTIFATLGEVCILDIDASTNQAIAGIQLKDNNFDQNYLYYFLLSLKDTVNAIGRGVAQNNINLKILRNIEVPPLSLAEQRKIAAVLDKLTELISLRKQQLAKLDEAVKARFVEMFEIPRSNEQGWPLKNIGDLFGLISRGKQPSYVECSSVRVINQACVYWDRFKLDNVKYHDSQSGKKMLPIEKGYILINSTGTGTLGRCNVFPGLSDGYTYVADSHVTILAESSDVNAYFFKYFFCRDDIQKKVYSECVNGSTNQIELSKEKLSKVLMVVPPLDRQEQFAAFVEQTEKSKLTIQQSLDKLEMLKNFLMQEYFG